MIERTLLTHSQHEEDASLVVEHPDHLFQILLSHLQSGDFQDAIRLAEILNTFYVREKYGNVIVGYDEEIPVETQIKTVAEVPKRKKRQKIHLSKVEIDETLPAHAFSMQFFLLFCAALSNNRDIDLQSEWKKNTSVTIFFKQHICVQDLDVLPFGEIVDLLTSLNLEIPLSRFSRATMETTITDISILHESKENVVTLVIGLTDTSLTQAFGTTRSIEITFKPKKSHFSFSISTNSIEDFPYRFSNHITIELTKRMRVFLDQFYHLVDITAQSSEDERRIVHITIPNFDD